ncbi:MAG: crotonase [Desulfuromonas sp.]|nr:MAG: crotonase [Desulfuromonas sp.]
MSESNLLVNIEDQIATITINRPKSLNAVTESVFVELEETIDDLEQDDDVAVIILTGAGDKAFVAGGDITRMVEATPEWSRDFAHLAQRVLNKIEASVKPVIAAINGYALGGGCELAMACDIRIASEKALFGQPEVKLGIIPGFAGTQRLSRLVGKGKAKEIIFTGEMFDAAEAHRIGLVNKVVAADELMQSCQEMASIIAQRSRTAVRLSKEAIDNGLEMDVARAEKYEADLFSLCFAMPDQREGMLAFVEKRAAVFKGK